jgi:hypothetical protein
MTTARKSKPTTSIIYFTSEYPLMPDDEITASLTGQAANPAIRAVLAMLDEEIATQTAVSAHPDTTNRDHAAGHSYGLLCFAKAIRERM